MKVFNTLQEAIDSIGYGLCSLCEAKHEFPNVKCDLMIGEKMGYEPPLEDDIALDKDVEDEEDTGEPDRMWGDE